MKKITQSILFVSLMMSLVFSLGFSSVSADPKYDYLITISTEFGDMKLILFDDTPIHKANFLKLVQEGKYNGTIFHRIIRNFMVQGGEIKFNNDSLTFIQKSLPSEIRPNRLHLQGALAAARPENPEKRSDLSQFYIVQNQSGTPFLNGNYTVFGQMLVGFNVLEKIVNQELNGSTPVKEIKMNISAEQVKRADIIKFYGDVYAQFDFK